MNESAAPPSPRLRGEGRGEGPGALAATFQSAEPDDAAGVQADGPATFPFAARGGRVPRRVP
jgi:hypothetical protein